MPIVKLGAKKTKPVTATLSPSFAKAVARASDPRKLCKDFLALDTETTGTDLYGTRDAAPHKPYIVSCYRVSPKTSPAAGLNGSRTHKATAKGFAFTFDVDPVSREPKYNTVEKNNLVRLLTANELVSESPIVFHNAKFDIRALGNMGIEWDNYLWSRTHDTLLMAHVFKSQGSHGLKDLALLHADVDDLDEKDLQATIAEAHRVAKKHHPKWIRSEKLPWDGYLPLALHKSDNRKGGPIVGVPSKYATVAQTYAERDAYRTALMFHFFVNALHDLGRWDIYLRELRLLRIVYQMEERGFPLNVKAAKAKSERLLNQAAEHKLFMQALVDSDKFNPQSGDQVAKVIFDKYQLPEVKLTNTGKSSTDAETIKECLEYAEQHGLKKPLKFLENLQGYKNSITAAKYVNGYLETGVKERNTLTLGRQLAVIHSSFNQVATGTTRFSSSGPNLQNVGVGDKEKGKETLRDIFKPRPGHFWYDIDYSNIELRIFAYCSKDKELIESFEKGISVHQIIAEALFGPMKKWKGYNPNDWKKSAEYKRTKNGNFALIYGAGITRADATYGLDGAYHKIRKRFPGIERLTSKLVNEAKEKGYIETLFGYPLYVPTDKSYAALNYFVQGTAGGVLKQGMINVDEYFKEKHTLENAPFIATIHDEVILELPNLLRPNLGYQTLRAEAANKTLRRIIDCLEQPGRQINIPIPVSVTYIPSDQDWARGEELKL